MIIMWVACCAHSVSLSTVAVGGTAFLVALDEGLGDTVPGDWKPPSVSHSGLSGYNMALTSSEQANESQRREGEGERE